VREQEIRSLLCFFSCYWDGLVSYFWRIRNTALNTALIVCFSLSFLALLSAAVDSSYIIPPRTHACIQISRFVSFRHNSFIG